MHFSVRYLFAHCGDSNKGYEPFDRWNGKDIEDAIVLIKVRGKCTTDHISMAGPWLKYKGHLENISNNTLIAAVNDANGKENCVENILTNTVDTVPEVAKYYQSNDRQWIVIGDDNYGEGSAREQAALQPRYLGGVAVIARSFARIHEVNLKKQGMLALTFQRKSDYDRIQSGDSVTIKGITRLQKGKALELLVKKRNGEILEPILLKHTLNEEQIEWFKAGSALNYLRQKVTAKEN